MDVYVRIYCMYTHTHTCHFVNGMLGILRMKSEFCAPQMCTSCCEGNICNILVPKNESTAVFSSMSPLVSAGRRSHLAARGYGVLILLFLLTADSG